MAKPRLIIYTKYGRYERDVTILDRLGRPFFDAFRWLRASA